MGSASSMGSASTQANRKRRMGRRHAEPADRPEHPRPDDRRRSASPVLPQLKVEQGIGVCNVILESAWPGDQQVLCNRPGLNAATAAERWKRELSS